MHSTDLATVRAFATRAAAHNWFGDLMADEDYCDNFRFAFKDDASELAEYEAQCADGCCGSADYTVLIAGREAYIGCNYGH